PRGTAAQAVAIDDEIIAGENRLIRHDRRGVVLLRLKQFDYRTLEWNNLQITYAHRQGWPDRALTFHEDYGGFVNGRWPILRLECRPNLGNFLNRHYLRDDLDLLDLISQLRSLKPGEERRLGRRHCHSANRIAGEHRHLVQDKHGEPKQGLCMQGTRSVGGKEITQVERQRGVAGSLAVGIARRKGNVTPALVLSRLEQEKIDPVRRRRDVVGSIERVVA